MKHLLKKLSIAGAGGKGSKPKPPIYKPPVMGELQYGASHSYAETLDLLSDGPIEGIVNSHGELVDGLNILQGIYLDNTPVAVTQQSARKSNELTPLEVDKINSFNVELDSSEGATYLSKFFQELEEVVNRSAAGKITALNSASAGGVDIFEAESWQDVGMMFLRDNNERNHDLVSYRSHSPFYPPVLPSTKTEFALSIRAYIKYRGAGGALTFIPYLNEETISSVNNTNPAYRNNAQPRGTIQNGSLIWGEDTLRSSKFLFAFDSSIDANIQYVRTQVNSIFADNIRILNNSILPDLNDILTLFNTNNSGANEPQRKLAERALGRIGWTEGSVENLFTEYVNGESGGIAICKVTSSKVKTY